MDFGTLSLGRTVYLLICSVDNFPQPEHRETEGPLITPDNLEKSQRKTHHRHNQQQAKEPMHRRWSFDHNLVAKATQQHVEKACPENTPRRSSFNSVVSLMASFEDVNSALVPLRNRWLRSPSANEEDRSLGNSGQSSGPMNVTSLEAMQEQVCLPSSDHSNPSLRLLLAGLILNDDPSLESEDFLLDDDFIASVDPKLIDLHSNFPVLTASKGGQPSCSKDTLSLQHLSSDLSAPTHNLSDLHRKTMDFLLCSCKDSPELSLFED